MLQRELFQEVDRLRNEINKRFEQMDTIDKKLDFSYLKLSSVQIETNLSNKDEVDDDELKLKIHRFKRYVLVSRDNNQCHLRELHYSCSAVLNGQMGIYRIPSNRIIDIRILLSLASLVRFLSRQQLIVFHH